MQREINEKRQELLAKEESLRWVSKADATFVVSLRGRHRNLESRLAAQGSQGEFRD